MRNYFILTLFTGHHWQFYILDENVSTQGIMYDYQSVMHLGYKAFGKKHLRTITPLKYKAVRGNSNYMYPTVYDFHHLNVLYCKGIHLHLSENIHTHTFTYEIK